MPGDDETRDSAARPAPSGPAPIIDLGGDAVPVRPVKPLGPRRLARLQRELAERSRELEQAGGDPADPDLLEKQRRFAELAAQAEAANAPSAGGTGVPSPMTPQLPATQPAPGQPGPEQPGARQTGPEEAVPAEGTEQITVVFPGADGTAGPDGHVGHDPVHVDPSLFSNRLAPEELAALTHIEILAPAEHHGSHAAGPDHAGDTAAPPAPDHAGDTAPPPPAPSGAAGAWPPDEEEPEAPAAPVPATAAGGLELLEPHEYRRGAGLRRLGLLLLVLLAALAVVLVLFVL